MRRPLRHAAMRRGLSGRVHIRRPGAHRDAGTTAGEIPDFDCRGEIVSKRHFVAWVLIVCAWTASAAEKPEQAAIASAHTLATKAGFEVLAKGGNAFDAAVAVAATLSVVEPQSSGIGGGGLFLVRRASDGKETMIDARETAPAAVDAKDYLKPNGEPDRDHALTG